MFLELRKGNYLKWIGVSIVITAASCVSDSAKKKVDSSNGTSIKKEKQIVEEVKPATESKTDTVSGEEIPGMIYFKGGKIKIGSYTGREFEQPVFETTIQPFWLDKNLVTVADFRKFVQETGYKTDADKFGNSLVFDFKTGKWEFVDGANWEYPFGRDKEPAKDNHPVTQVSYHDAKAYAKWAGRRLPTEFEWEYAARNGKNTGQNFPWGNELVVDGKYMANVWQGPLQPDPEVKDGFLYTSPVGYYGETPAGLTDMSGNVWQWTDSYFIPYPGSPHEGRAGPDENSRVLRGGSFMYDEYGPLSNSVWFRSMNTVETSLFNMGFRCAR
ncbi:MAG: formylglycine-generating enzyme family protein [Chlorobi bacterium]|nr:formylglycine-generating enzyme family protein [Chlorobiota bacterium]